MFTGLAGQLSVSVSQYDPIGVECLGPGEGAPSESSCADALELVPVDKTWMVFGPPEDASTEVTIPAGFSDGELLPRFYLFQQSLRILCSSPVVK